MNSDQTLADAAEIILPPRLDLTVVRDLGGDFLDRDGHPLQVNAQDVQHVGGLGLQLLMAAAQQWRQRNLDMRISPRSDAFDKAISEFGVSLEMLEHKVTA